MSSKELKYNRLLVQLQSLLKKSPSLYAQIVTINAILYHKISYIFWVGVYFYHNNNLIIGPYQGPVACQTLEKNKGVCWHTLNNRQTTIVSDVNKFPGHITCDSRSKSEIVIPILNHNNIFGVLDVDSNKLNAFDENDAKGLENIINLLNFDLPQFI